MCKEYVYLLSQSSVTLCFITNYYFHKRNEKIRNIFSILECKSMWYMKNKTNIFTNYK